MTGLFFIVVLVAVIAAVIFAVQARAAAGALQSLQAAAESAKKEAEAARAKAKELEAELKTRSQQLAETREKLNDVRKKAQDSRAPKTTSGSVRIAELEEDLRNARDLTEQAHASDVAARKEAQAAKAEAAAREADVARLQEKVRQLTAQLGALPKPGSAVTTLPTAAPQEDLRVKELEQTRRELQAKLDAADAQLKEDHKKLAESRDEMRKARGRAETNNRVYMVTKSELELIKERLAHAERRLWQSGIPLAPPEQKPRPKGKGPLAVDRPEGEATTPAEASDAAATAPQAEAQALAQPPAEPPEPEAPRAAVVAGPSDDILQRIGGPKRRRPAAADPAPASVPPPATDAGQTKH